MHSMGEPPVYRYEDCPPCNERIAASPGGLLVETIRPRVICEDRTEVVIASEGGGFLQIGRHTPSVVFRFTAPTTDP